MIKVRSIAIMLSCEKWVEITWLLNTVKGKRARGKASSHCWSASLKGKRRGVCALGRGFLRASLLWRWEVAYSFSRANRNAPWPFQQGWWTASGERLTFQPLQLPHTFWDMNLQALQYMHIKTKWAHTQSAICTRQNPELCTCIGSFYQAIYKQHSLASLQPAVPVWIWWICVLHDTMPA